MADPVYTTESSISVTYTDTNVLPGTTGRFGSGLFGRGKFGRSSVTPSSIYTAESSITIVYTEE